MVVRNIMEQSKVHSSVDKVLDLDLFLDKSARNLIMYSTKDI